MVWAYGCIVFLSLALVVMNVRSAVAEFEKHRFISRLISQIATLMLVSGMLITISYRVIDRSMEAAASLQEEATQHRVPPIVSK